MMSSHYVSQSIWPHGGVAKKLNDRMGEAGKSSYVNNSLGDCLTVFRCFVSARNQKILGIRILWWKRAYKSPFSKFLISVEKSTPKLSVMS